MQIAPLHDHFASSNGRGLVGGLIRREGIWPGVSRRVSRRRRAIILSIDRVTIVELAWNVFGGASVVVGNELSNFVSANRQVRRRTRWEWR